MANPEHSHTDAPALDAIADADVDIAVLNTSAPEILANITPTALEFMDSSRVAASRTRSYDSGLIGPGPVVKAKLRKLRVLQAMDAESTVPVWGARLTKKVNELSTKVNELSTKMDRMLVEWENDKTMSRNQATFRQGHGAIRPLLRSKLELGGHLMPNQHGSTSYQWEPLDGDVPAVGEPVLLPPGTTWESPLELPHKQVDRMARLLSDDFAIDGPDSLQLRRIKLIRFLIGSNT